jgi:hypothetical protein
VNLDEMIERLEEIREEVGGDFPVRGAFQPNYVLLSDVDAITTVTESGDENGVFICLGNGHEYGSREHYSDDFITIRDEDEEDEPEEDEPEEDFCARCLKTDDDCQCYGAEEDDDESL